jgi:hypothetical protein
VARRLVTSIWAVRMGYHPRRRRRSRGCAPVQSGRQSVDREEITVLVEYERPSAEPIRPDNIQRQRALPYVGGESPQQYG